MEQVALISFGFILAWIPKWLDRKRKVRSHWNAISAEVFRIEKKAKMLINDKIAAPLYRLPLKSYGSSFVMLLSEGAVTKHEVNALEEFYDHAEEINRGLDQSSVALSNQEKSRLTEEFNRIVVKAKRLISDPESEGGLIDPVNAIVKKKCSQCLFQY